MQEMRKCKAISFDGDMTLWDFDKVMRHSLSKALDYLQTNYPTAATENLTIDKMIDLRNDMAEALKGQITNLEEIRLQAFIHTLKFVGCDDVELATELNAIYLKHRFEDIELYDDAKPVLDGLSKHRPCGLISNGNSYPERCGLAEVLSFVVFSQDVGIEKPHPDIFEVALKDLSYQPEQLVHVGDSLESDVAGANAIGAVSVWLNRKGVKNTSAIVPDFEISTLKELLELIPSDT